MAKLTTSYKNAVYITSKFMSIYNLKDYQAVGFAGCFMAESRCNPASYNKAEKAGTFPKSTANGPGYGAGLAQWSNARKSKLQKLMNMYTPIETWSLDQQITAISKECSNSFINLLRNCSSAAESTDIILRGYENGGGGTSTSLRSKKSMASYTWCKTVYIPDVGNRTFPDGYIGALSERTAWARKVLEAMGNMSAEELTSLGSIIGAGSGTDFASLSVAAQSLSPEQLRQYIQQSLNAYPVHSEYETYTGSGGNLFTSAADNAFSIAVLATNIDSSHNIYKNANKRTRIYSTNDATIILDELKLPIDISVNDNWTNKGVTKQDVERWQKEQDKQKEEAKKCLEEEKLKQQEEQQKIDAEVEKVQNENKQKEEIQNVINNMKTVIPNLFGKK